MKSLKERVLEQIQREYPISETEAHWKLEVMPIDTALQYVSNELDEMFKEFEARMELKFVPRLQVYDQ